jgi:pseudaminic acid biosynthesis-associated methylase
MAEKKSASRQLDTWEGGFGQEYTERTKDRKHRDWQTRVPAFQTMLDGLEINRILEVGCNRGHNLLSLLDVLGEETEIIGVEPNRYALELARQSSPKVAALYGHTLDLPFKDGYFDLVFTAGVLIHIALSDIPDSLAEIYRASQRYILAIEYFAEEETIVPYHGSDNLLWKRDFRQHYQTLFPDLRLVRDGYWESEAGFDNTHWWLFEKPQL